MLKKIFGLHKKNNKKNVSDESINKKSFFDDGLAFNDFLLYQGYRTLSTIVTLRMYQTCMPFFNAVNTRASYFSQIPLRVYDKKDNEYLDNHESLELIDNPNADVTRNEFLYQTASYLDITGNCFIIATGDVNKPPLEIIVIPPQYVTFESIGGQFSILGAPQTITVNIPYVSTSIGDSIRFEAVEVNGNLKFYSGDNYELWHIRYFNPYRDAGNFWGMSQAQPLFFEIQQYISGNYNNFSNLERGARPSMAWVNKTGEQLTEEQYNRIKEQVQKYSGSKNTGGTPILDGVEIQTISLTNTEMQFKDTQQAVFSRINNTYGIPLAKLIDSVMTLSNLETSTLQLYDDAIIPLLNYIYAELTQFILSRYQNSDNLEFKFNPNDIEALRVRSIEMTKRQADIGVNTINELRSLLGYESVSKGGDQLWQNSTLLPIATDQFTEDNPKKPQNKSKIINDFVTRRRAKQLIKSSGYL